VRERIRGYTDAIIEEIQNPAANGQAAAPAGSLAQTALQMAAIRDLVSGSRDLAATLVNPDVSPPSKRALMTDLLARHVGEPAVRLVTYVIEADRASEIVDDLVWLAERVDAAAHDLVPAGGPVLGRKAAEERVDGFATAVLEELTGERALVAVEDELFRLLQAVKGSSALEGVLSSRAVTPAARRQVVVDLLRAQSAPAAVRLAAYATQVGRPRDYADLLAFLVDRVAAEGHRRVAEVRSAVHLDEEQQERLGRALSSVIGHDLDLRVTVDTSIVGGFVATIGDTVVDGSTRRRLEILKDRLVTQEAAVPVRSDRTAGNTVITGEPRDG